jgi:hypothetical protein
MALTEYLVCSTTELPYPCTCMCMIKAGRCASFSAMWIWSTVDPEVSIDAIFSSDQMDTTLRSNICFIKNASVMEYASKKGCYCNGNLSCPAPSTHHLNQGIFDPSGIVGLLKKKQCYRKLQRPIGASFIGVYIWSNATSPKNQTCYT